MRITMLAASVGNPFGQERVLALSAAALRAAGHEIEVITDHVLGGVAGTSRITPIPSMSRLGPFSTREMVDRIEKEIAAACNRFRPDVVHFIDFLDERVLQTATKFAPAVLTAHTVAPTCPASTRQSKRTQFCQRKSGYACLIGNYQHGCLSYFKSDLHRAHAIYGFQRRKVAYRKTLKAVFAISGFVKQCLIQDGWSKDLVHHVPNPLETLNSDRIFEKDPHTILVCSRLTDLKGVDTVLRAVALIKDTPFSLRICGDGSEKKKWIQLSEQLGLSRKVSWLGQLPPSEVAHEMEKAAIFVQANRGPEAFGMALAEAMNWGCACVVSRMPALTDLVTDGKTGLVFEKNSATQLAEKIRTLLLDEKMRQSLGSAAKDLIGKNFSVDSHLEATLKQYQSCAIASDSEAILASGAK